MARRPERSGGGELIDQGVHLIDLPRWFLGDFTDVEGFAAYLFLGHAGRRQRFLLLRTADGQIAFLHASCTEWKKLFSFEIYGRDGKIAIDGLGGSYGVERWRSTACCRRWARRRPTIWEYPGGTIRGPLEFAEFPARTFA